jgi:hypothetical protein
MTAHESGSIPTGADDAALSLPAVITWLGVHLFAIGLSVARVPFWAHSTEPADAIAVDVMVVSQLVAIALLFPLLLQNWRTAAVAVLIGQPFILMAGLLAGMQQSRLLYVSASVTLWMIALWMGTAIVRGSRRGTMLGVATVACITLGGPLLVYVRLESGSQTGFDWTHLQRFGPILSAEATLRSRPLSPTSLIFPAIAVTVGAALRMASRLIRHREW